MEYSTARQCSPLGRKFMECYIIKPVVHWSAFRNHQGSTFTEKDRNKLNYRIGPLVSDLITVSDQAVRAVHSCNSWLYSLLHLIYFDSDNDLLRFQHSCAYFLYFYTFILIFSVLEHSLATLVHAQRIPHRLNFAYNLSVPNKIAVCRK